MAGSRSMTRTALRARLWSGRGRHAADESARHGSILRAAAAIVIVGGVIRNDACEVRAPGVIDHALAGLQRAVPVQRQAAALLLLAGQPLILADLGTGEQRFGVGVLARTQY